MKNKWDFLDKLSEKELDLILDKMNIGISKNEKSPVDRDDKLMILYTEPLEKVKLTINKELSSRQINPS